MVGRQPGLECRLCWTGGPFYLEGGGSVFFLEGKISIGADARFFFAVKSSVDHEGCFRAVVFEIWWTFDRGPLCMKGGQRTDFL